MTEKQRTYRTTSAPIEPEKDMPAPVTPTEGGPWALLDTTFSPERLDARPELVWTWIELEPKTDVLAHVKPLVGLLGALTRRDEAVAEAAISECEALLPGARLLWDELKPLVVGAWLESSAPPSVPVPVTQYPCPECGALVTEPADDVAIHPLPMCAFWTSLASLPPVEALAAARGERPATPMEDCGTTLLGAGLPATPEGTAE